MITETKIQLRNALIVQDKVSESKKKKRLKEKKVITRSERDKMCPQNPPYDTENLLNFIGVEKRREDSKGNHLQ